MDEVELVQHTNLVWDEALRQKFLSLLKQKRWSYGKISRKLQHRFRRRGERGEISNLGLGETSLYTYASLRWKGSQEALIQLEERVRAWIQDIMQNGDQTEVDRDIGSADLIERAIEEARLSRQIVVVIGPAGAGKSLISENYVNRQSGEMVFLECLGAMTHKSFIRALAEALDEDMDGSRYALVRRVWESLKESQSTLVIDEANYLPRGSFDDLLAIWNKSHPGIALLGTPELDEIVKSEGCGKFYSRVRRFIYLGALSEKEIRGRLEQFFEPRTVTAGVVEQARWGSHGRFRDLETLIELAIDSSAANPEYTLEEVFERIAGRSLDYRAKKQ